MINYIKYIYGSEKGNIPRGGDISSPMAHHRNEYTYSSEVVEEENFGGEGNDDFTGNDGVTLAYTPIRPGTVSFTVGGVNFTDDGDGNLVGTGLASSGTINYETGFAEFVLSNVAGSDVTVSYEFNLEYAPSTIPQVDIKIESLPVIARSRKLRALYAFDAAFDLRRSYGGDIDTLLSSQIAAEIAHEIDAELCDALRTQAGLPGFSFNKSPRVGIAVVDHYDSFYNVLVEVSNSMFQSTRRATGNFLIVGTGAASVVETMRSFRADNVTSPVGPHKIGTLGPFTVYKNPYYPANDVVMGFRGGSYFEAGYFYCPYMPVITTDLIMLDDFKGRRGWATSYAKKMVNNQLYATGQIINESQYSVGT